MRRKLAALAALLMAITGMAVTIPGQAHAYLWDCHTQVSYTSPYPEGSGTAVCYNHANNGGQNLVRVKIRCVPQSGSGFAYDGYGPWKGQNVVSYTACSPGYHIIGPADYLLA